jgi:O-antigen ligase
MDEVKLTMSEALLYVALGGAVVGFLLGLVPLIVGIIKKKVKTGVIGLIVSTLGGALLGVFISIPAMAIFTWLILREQVVATDAVASPREPDSQDTKEN